MKYLRHRRLLAKWLAASDILLGVNLLYDIDYLRAFSPIYAHLLNGRHLIIDFTYVNFLESDVRPERSLKNIGPLLGTHHYDEDLLPRLPSGERERYPDIESLARYNAHDSHNAALDIAELARRIQVRYPDTDKLSPCCLKFYSDTIWVCADMSRAGVPFHRPSLSLLHEDLSHVTRSAERHLRRHHHLYLSTSSAGRPGICKQSKATFLRDTIKEIDRWDPLLQLTPKTKEVSWKDSNRELLRSLLPPESPRRAALGVIEASAKAQKLLSSYTYPYLLHRRSDPSNRKSVLVPQPKGRGRDPEVWLSHPSWFITPSNFKDDSADMGGTQQGRITCHAGGHQTDPPKIQSFRRSRYVDGRLVGMDLSQIELRVAAVLSGEPTLLEAFNKGLDLHTDRAISIFTLETLTDLYGVCFRDSQDFRKIERQVGKRVNFADLFRAGAETMQQSVLADCGTLFPLSLFQGIVRDRPVVRPVLWTWQESVIQEARAQGHLVLPFTGQSRSFPPPSRGAKYDVNEIVNFKVQTFAGNILLQIQAYLRPRLPLPIKMYLNVYDAVKFDCPSYLLDQLKDLIEEAVRHVETQGMWAWMCETTGHRVPLAYDLSVD